VIESIENAQLTSKRPEVSQLPTTAT